MLASWKTLARWVVYSYQPWLEVAIERDRRDAEQHFAKKRSAGNRGGTPGAAIHMVDHTMSLGTR